MTNTRSASRVFLACDLERPSFNVTLNGATYNRAPMFREGADYLAETLRGMYPFGIVKIERI